MSPALWCTACNTGQYGIVANDTGVCEECPKGREAPNEETQDECTLCAPGEYSNVTGSDECTVCPNRRRR